MLSKIIRMLGGGPPVEETPITHHITSFTDAPNPLGKYSNVELMRQLENVEESVRHNALRALRERTTSPDGQLIIGKLPGAILGLGQFLSDPNENARRYAAWALGNLAIQDENKRLIAQHPEVVSMLFQMFLEDKKLHYEVHEVLDKLMDYPENWLLIGKMPEIIKKLLKIVDHYSLSHLKLRDKEWATDKLAKLLAYAEKKDQEKIVEKEEVCVCLKGYFSSPNVLLRKIAAIAIGNIALHKINGGYWYSHSEFIKNLLESLQDKDRTVRKEAIKALTNFFNHEDYEVRAYKSYLRKNPGMISKMIALIPDADPEEKRDIIRILKNFTAGSYNSEDKLLVGKIPAVISELVQCLGNSDNGVRKESVYCIKNILEACEENKLLVEKTPGAILALLGLLQGSDEEIQEQALKIFYHLNSEIGEIPGAISSLMRFLLTRNEVLKENSLQALCRLTLIPQNQLRVAQEPDAIKHFIQCLKDSNEGIRMWSVYTLNNLLNHHENKIFIQTIPPIIPALTLLLQEPNQTIKKQAGEALEKLTPAAIRSSLPTASPTTLFSTGIYGGPSFIGTGNSLLPSPMMPAGTMTGATNTSVVPQAPVAPMSICTTSLAATNTTTQMSFLLRIWGGKYTAGEQPIYVPSAPKTSGDAVGAFFVKSKTKPHMTDGKKTWIGKLGFLQAAPTETRSHKYASLMRMGTVRESVREKCAMDIYYLLSGCLYETPKTRLAILPIENEFTSVHMLTTLLLENLNRGRVPGAPRVTDGVYVMSKFIEGYQDLASLTGCVLGDERLSFLACLERGFVPEFFEIEDKKIRIRGIMSILAVSRLIADTDVLGGGAKNAGFVIELDSTGQPNEVRMVKIDAGASFNFTGETNMLLQSFNEESETPKLIDKRDIQFGNIQPATIKWEALKEAQKEEFLGALDHGLHRLKEPALFDFILRRGGAFSRAGDGVMSETEITAFGVSLNRCLNRQERVYAAELSVYRVRHPDPTSSRYALAMTNLMEDTNETVGAAASATEHWTFGK